jgi:hypothetical protein
MAAAVSPVIPGFEHLEIPVAEDQEEYETLPMLPLNDKNQNILTRWKFTPEELEFIAKNGYVHVYTMTFGHKIQPMYVSAEEIKLGTRSKDDEGSRTGAGDNGSHP